MSIKVKNVSEDRKEDGEGEDHPTNENILRKQEEIRNRLLQKQQHWFDLALNPETIPQFDIDDLLKFANDDGIWNASIAIFGQRRTGKSTLAKDLLIQLNERKLIGRIGIITDTDQNQFWKDMIPEATIYPVDLAVETINQILAFQKYIKNQYEKGKKIEPEGVLQYTLILDDFAHDKKFSRYSDSFAKVYGTGRHFNMSVMLLTQHPAAVSTFVRSNSDFVFVVKASGKRNIEHIVNDHLFFMNPEAGRAIIGSSTNDYNVLVINKTPNLHDEVRLWTFKAKVIKEKPPLGDPKWREIIDSQIQTKDDSFDRSKAIERRVNRRKFHNEVVMKNLVDFGEKTIGKKSNK